MDYTIGVTGPSKNQLLQQQAEQRHVEVFLKLLQLDAVIVPGDKPDFVLVKGDWRVGLEHREMFDQDLQKNRALTKRFEKELVEELKRKAVGADFDMAVFFEASSTFFVDNPPAIGPLATQIAVAAAAAQATVVSETVLTVGPAKVRLHRIPNLTEGPLACVQPFWWGEGQQMVRAAIRGKETKLQSYQSGAAATEFWLLLVTGETWTQTVDSVLLQGFRVESKFERVYLLDLVAGKVQRIDASAS